MLWAIPRRLLGTCELWEGQAGEGSGIFHVELQSWKGNNSLRTLWKGVRNCEGRP